MKKEIIIAIIVGFTVGLIITFGIYQAQKTYVDEITDSSQPTAAPIASPSPEPEAHSLDIITPLNFDISESGTIISTGFTTPYSYVTASTVDTSSIAQANASGSFTLEIEIEVGATEIVFTSLAPDGTPAIERRTVSLLEQPSSANDTVDEDDELSEEEAE